MSSDIFSCKRDYTKFDMFYAVTQKNLGIAGTALVVISKQMLQKQVRNLPPMWDYNAHVKEKSVLNTANVFGIFVCLLMLRWIKAKGIENIEKENKLKAKLLYEAIDDSRQFVPYIQIKEHRSQMNVCFNAKKQETEKVFLALCEENNITGIAGHRSIGGFRVSLYNAITLESVQKLVNIIKIVDL